MLRPKLGKFGFLGELKTPQFLFDIYWPLKALDKIHDNYGGVVSVNMGPSKKSVVIGDYHSLKEAFKDDKGNGRPLDFGWLNEEFRHGDGTDSRGILFSVVSNIFDTG